MSNTAARLALLRKIALACALLVLAVTSLSAFIRLSRAGLGCEPWPQCYRQRAALPVQAVAPLDEGTVVAARGAHRVAATVVLLLVIALLMLALARNPMLWAQGRLVLGLLGVALFLAVLGRMGADSRHPLVVLGNLLGGFALLALNWRLVQATGAGSPPTPAAARLRPWVFAALALLVLHIGLGGLVSAQFVADRCDASAACQWHRAGGFVVAAVLFTLGALAWRAGRRAGALVAVAVLAQLGLGLLMLATAAPLPLAFAHNLLAALLLAALLSLAAPPP